MVWVLWGAGLGLERGRAGLKSWTLVFRAAGESCCTPKPSEVPHYPLKLMVVFEKTEAQRRRDSADLAELMQKGRSRARNWGVPCEAGAWMKEWVYSPDTSLGLLLIPPTLPTKLGPKVLPNPRAGAAEETVTNAPPSFLQTCPGPQLRVLSEKGWGTLSEHCRAV